MGNHLANDRSIIQDTGLLTLTKHLIEVALIHFQAIALQHHRLKSRRFLLPHRRQLSLVTDNHQTVVAPLINKMHQVVQQKATSEIAIAQSEIRNHGSLIHHKQGVGIEIIIQIEFSIHTGKRFLTVDTAMNGIGRATAVEREYLSRPTRRS